MTSTEQQTERDTEFGVGDPCGVCHFPVGPGQICGNTVYATKEKGRLPAYCGSPGQKEWQEQHGTEGAKGHRSDVAKYPRDKFGMTKEETAALAEAEAARRGYTRRLKAEAPAAAPVATAPVVPATPPTLDDLVAALPGGPIDALGQLAQLLLSRVGAARKEMENVWVGAHQQIAEMEREVADTEEKQAYERAALDVERAKVKALREQAETQIKEANDARLRTEGERDSARQRIAELEQQIAAAEQRHRAEVDRVRREERDNFIEGMKALGSSYQHAAAAPAPEPVREVPVTEQAILDIGARVGRNEVAWRDGVWIVNNVKATTATATMLDHMRKVGFIQAGSMGEPERVTLTEAYPGPPPRRAR